MVSGQIAPSAPALISLGCALGGYALLRVKSPYFAEVMFVLSGVFGGIAMIGLVEVLTGADRLGVQNVVVGIVFFVAYMALWVVGHVSAEHNRFAIGMTFCMLAGILVIAAAATI